MAGGNIIEALRKKGFEPLMATQDGGIGFKKSFKENNHLLEKPVWFDIGQTMFDSEGNTTRMTVAAKDKLQYAEYCKKGWKPLAPGESHILKYANLPPVNPVDTAPRKGNKKREGKKRGGDV